GSMARLHGGQKLVAAAPPLKHWKIIAFRQRMALRTNRGPAFDTCYERFKLRTDDVFFRARADNGKIGLELYVKNYVPDDQRIQSAVYLLLDSALGEYDVETKIGSIEILPLPEPSGRVHLQSIY